MIEYFPINDKMVFMCIKGNQKKIFDKIAEDIDVNVVFSEKTALKILDKQEAKKLVTK